MGIIHLWMKSNFFNPCFTILLILKFYENYEIFENFWKFYHFEFFWNSMKFLKVLKFYENFELKKNNKIFRKFWNFMNLSNILINKKQLQCNKNPYCTLVSRIFIHSFIHKGAIWLFIAQKLLFANQYVRKWNVTCIASGQ